MDFNQCACSGKSLVRLLRPAIMAILGREPAHGYQLAQNLRTMRMFAAQAPDHTGIYRALKEMEDEELLKSAWDLADAGPARRVFALTRKGKSCLAKWRRTLRNYRAGIDELLGLIGQPRRRT